MIEPKIKIIAINMVKQSTVIDSIQANTAISTLSQNETKDFVFNWTPDLNNSAQSSSQYLVKLKVFTPDGIGLIFQKGQILKFTKQTIPANTTGCIAPLTQINYAGK